MKGIEGKQMKHPNLEASKIVDLNDQIKQSREVIESTKNPRLKAIYEQNVALLEEEKQALSERYWKRQPPEKRLARIMDQIDELKKQPGMSYDSEEYKKLQRQFDEILTDHDFYAEENKEHKEHKEQEPHLHVTKEPKGVSPELENMRRNIGHKPLSATITSEASGSAETDVALDESSEPSEWLQQKREELGHAPLTLKPIEKESNGGAEEGLDTAHETETHMDTEAAEPDRAHTTYHEVHTTQSAVPEQQGQIPGFFGRMKRRLSRWFRG